MNNLEISTSFAQFNAMLKLKEFPKAGESQYFHSEKYRSWQDIDS